MIEDDGRVLDVHSARARVLVEKVTPIFEQESVADTLAALCLLVCFAVDHVKEPDDKLAVYEGFIREMAAVMKVAPGVKK